MFLVQLSLSLAFLGVLYAEPPVSSNYGVPSTSYGTPFSAGGSYADGSGSGYNNYGSYDNHNAAHAEDNQPKSYEFGYAVKDDYSGNDYGRKESSDGNAVRGEYRVNLPDGRVQIVTYYADWQSGFHADVRYEGTAVYPEEYKTFGHSGNQYGAGNYNKNYASNNNYGGKIGANNYVTPADVNNLISQPKPYNYNDHSNTGSNFGYKTNAVSSSYGAPGY